MSLSRRKTLALLGGGVILAATTGAGIAVTRTPRTALAPWEAAGAYDEPRRRALSWALLAPNPHNRQPWLADLSTEGEVTLYVDTDRLLPETDPYNRQITIGLGCFLELMRMAAAEDGFRVDLALFPEGEDPAGLDGRPVARAVFVADAGIARDPLFAQIPHRRTLKEPYDTARPVPAEILTQIASAALITRIDTTNDPAQVQVMRDISTEAFEIEFATHRTLKESVDLFRIGAGEVDANPDGIDFSGPMFETLRLTRLFTREASLDPDSIPSRSAIDMVTRNMQTGMAHLWQVTPGNSRAEQIVAGQDWVRMNLAATALGVGMQPLSQALQEFPEMAGLYRQVHEMLAPGGGTVQMWARLGYGPTVPPSPRWPLDAKIVET
ncbi:Acg family FMN-binding oxidoreductase [Palleronia sp. KMU-117]|uniref:Acg family FMN-binding oxidoreductase n=1 Tax=Palleronia sp. KMU-117 TaxID=3434108 RepID=UPI003D71E08F